MGPRRHLPAASRRDEAGGLIHSARGAREPAETSSESLGWARERHPSGPGGCAPRSRRGRHSWQSSTSKHLEYFNPLAAAGQVPARTGSAPAGSRDRHPTGTSSSARTGASGLVAPATLSSRGTPAFLFFYERGCQEETSPPTPDAFLLHRSPCTGSAWRRPGLVMVMSRTARVPWVRTWLVSTMLLLGTRGPLHALVVRGGICSAKGLDLMSGQEGT